MEESLKINNSIWNKFETLQMQEYQADLYRHYRNVGFPYYPIDSVYRENELNKFLSYDISSMYQNFKISGNLERSTHGLALCWSYMRHAFDVKCNNYKTPYEVFHDDSQFKQCIAKRIHIGTNMSDSGIRKILRTFRGIQSVSNFRPTSAACIYKKYAPNGKVWDMSSGYGGRMLGSVYADVQEYIGTDPCKETYMQLCNMKNDLFKKRNINLFKIGSEDFEWNENYFDLCFTSPPYFNTEKYSDEDTQSFNKFPSRNEWKEGFLRKTIKNCYKYLKSRGYLIINIANVPNYDTLEADCVANALSENFIFKELNHYILSTHAFSKSKLKTEPIFIFQKL